ncbi:MAG: hypothetical protein AAFO07_12580 [Bacteroidota bacterium]
MDKLLSVLLVAITFSSIHAQKRIDELNFLLGEFDVTVMLPQQDKSWKQGGEGTASFYPILDDTFIREDLDLTFGQGTLTMSNSIGRDGRMNQLRMIAMDKEFATIDIYKGELNAGKLIFNNLTSDIPALTPEGKRVSFKITYSQLSKQKNESLVEITYDEGRTWTPYSKQIFKRSEEK